MVVRIQYCIDGTGDKLYNVFYKVSNSLRVFCSRTSRNKLNDIHENCLCLLTNHCDSNFNKLLEASQEISIHKTCINYLMIEVHKYLHGLSPELMNHIFAPRKTTYNIRNIRLLYSYKHICNTNNL